MTNFEPFMSAGTINMIRGWRGWMLLTATVSIVFLLSSCQKQERPKGVLGQEEFARMLMDFYLVEARLSMVTPSRDSAMKLFVPFEDSLMRKFNVTEESMKKTYYWYLEHPEELGQVYDRVIDSLSIREHRANSGQVRI